MDRWSRRQVVQGAGAMSLALAAGCGRWPGQSAQQPAQMTRIGWLAAAYSPESINAFREGLRALGYLEGQNIVLEARTAEGIYERLPGLAAELARLPVGIIVAEGSPAVLAARDATPTIPIVFATTGDPVSTGLVDSLARPGGNVTGTSNLVPQLSGKRLELLKEIVPNLSTVAYLWDPTVLTGPVNWKESQVAAQALGLRLISLEVSSEAPDLGGAFEQAVGQAADGLACPLGPTIVTYREQIVVLAARYRLPAVYPEKPFAVAGGLIAYGADRIARVRQAATYVDRILKGAKPADLPVEQPTRFDFVINLKTAQALGLTIPEHVLLQATEVLQ